MNALEVLLRLVATFFEDRQQQWALVGGLAVSVRTEPRFTRDLDVAVAVSDDLSAERLIYQLHGAGLHTFATVEHEVTKRLSTARLNPGKTMHEGLVLDPYHISVIWGKTGFGFAITIPALYVNGSSAECEDRLNHPLRRS